MKMHDMAYDGAWQFQEPLTLYVQLTRGKHEIRDNLVNAFGAFERVVIDVDGERHEYDADALIALLEELEKGA